MGAYAAPSPDSSHVVHGLQNLVGFNVTSLNTTQTSNVTLQGFRWLNGLDWNSVTNRILLMTAADGGASIAWSVTPEGKDLRPLYSDSSAALEMCSSPAADALYIIRDSSELVKLKISGEQTRDPVVLTPGLQGSGPCSVSADGQRLLFLRRSEYSNLWRLDLQSPTRAATAITTGTSQLFEPYLSDDGQWVIATEAVNFRIVKMPLAGGAPIHVVDGANGRPSPDGRRLLFERDKRIFTSDLDGNDIRQVRDVPVMPGLSPVWLPDGRLAWKTPDARNYRIRELESGREELLVKSPEVGWVFNPRFSPNADEVAVYWNRREGGDPGLWLLSWPDRIARFLQPVCGPSDGRPTATGSTHQRPMANRATSSVCLVARAA